MFAAVLFAFFSITTSVAALKETAADSASKSFLTDYAAQEESVVLESGLMYKVLKDGSGGSPGLSTPCQCHYEGRLAKNHPSGVTFDSSYQRGQPATFA